METPTKTSLHPVIWIAAIAVTLFSLVGIAKLTGLLPGSSTASQPASATTEAPPPVTASAPVTPPPATAPAPEPAPVAAAPVKPAAPKPVVAKKKATTYSSNPTEPMPGDTYTSNIPPPPVCTTCGEIYAITPVQQKGQGSGLGAVAGGIVGGLLGNQIGRGTGRDIATIGGAVGGAFAGNAVEQNTRTKTVFDVTVRYLDGGTEVFRENLQPVWQIGDKVRVDNGQIVPR
ncbi:MAG TPA: glycine zipper 2TM domain-containing protein [Rhodocyclaceae bacterium]|nr:glycine zipper 2TM domain-containing protein [Rhodocyclaceae bacterium]